MQVVKETIELMQSLREIMNDNWQTLEVEKIQPRWCCGEYPYLFRGASPLFVPSLDCQPDAMTCFRAVGGPLCGLVRCQLGEV